MERVVSAYSSALALTVRICGRLSGVGFGIRLGPGISLNSTNAVADPRDGPRGHGPPQSS